MSATHNHKPNGLETFTATGNNAEVLKADLFKQAQGRELYFQVVEEEDGSLSAYGYPRTQVMDLIYELAYPVLKLVDDRSMLKVKSNRAVTDFFIIIQSRKGGAYIGKHGQTLDAAEGLISFLAGRKFPGRVNISLDVDNYRRKRTAFLEGLIRKVVSDIERDHAERPIRDLLPKERKFVHQYFTNHPYLATESRGAGSERTIYILPRTDIVES